MLIKLCPNFIMASPAGVWHAGEVIDVDEGTARALVEAGAAVICDEELLELPVTALAEEPFVGRYEKSVKRRGRPKR